VGCVELFLGVGEPTALGFLERDGDGVGFAFVAQIAQDPQIVEGVGESGQNLVVGA
jgi:hypothetical protein